MLTPHILFLLIAIVISIVASVFSTVTFLLLRSLLKTSSQTYTLLFFIACLFTCGIAVIGLFIIRNIETSSNLVFLILGLLF